MLTSQNRLNSLKVSVLITGIFVLIVGIVTLSLCIWGNNRVNQAQANNSMKGHSKVKNDKCYTINQSKNKVGLTGLFCNANTPSTWLNDQEFAKKFYPKDMDDQAHLYKDNKTPAPFYSAINLYGERERQVESAQLLGQFQGQMYGGGQLGICLIVFGIADIILGLAI